MALWCENTYLSVWKVETDGDKVYARLSSSSKNKEGNYENDFSARALVVGQAKKTLAASFDFAKNGNKPLFVKAKVKITNNYDKEKNQMFWNVVMIQAENFSRASESENDEDISENDDALW